MTIFYNNSSLKDTMLIALSNKVPNNIKNNDSHTALYYNDELVGVNIFDVSKTINLNNGIIYPTLEILDFIKEITKLDFSKFIKPNFVVSEIIECEEVPNTHLHKCQVNLGNEVTQIVCGAKNARKGLKTVCATVGTFMPNGLYIDNGQLMSIPSHGMLCSSKELKISPISSGIIELNNSYKIGEEFSDVYSNL